MKVVLFPYDHSASAQRALQYLINFSKTHQALEVHVLNVQGEPRLHGRNNPLVAEVQQQIEAHAREHAEEIADHALRSLRDAGITCTRHAHVGEVLPEINRVIQQCGCDTVIMGTRGMGGLGNLLLGSVATQVIHGVDVPVLLVK